MNMDFHYYATYLAARIAQFSAKEAKIVAYAAQYVDDLSAFELDRNLLPGLRRVTPTVEKYETISYKNVISTQAAVRESEEIWSSFHFLPGNINKNDPKRNYTGKRSWGRGYWKYSYGSEEECAFSMMCLPNSELSEQMINDTCRYRGEAFFLVLIGIRMHVLADTWAHSYFAGTPNWWVNEVVQSAEYLVETTEAEKRFDPYLKTPPAGAFHSYAYLGHARMGGIPDAPYMCYSYRPQWSENKIIKDNRSDFMKAFGQMISALKCIRSGSCYKKDSYEAVPNEISDKIIAIFKDVKYTVAGAAAKWKKLIEELYPGESIEEYSSKKWREEAEGEANKANTQYYQFNRSAVMHLEFVEKYLEAVAVENMRSPSETVQKKWLALIKESTAPMHYICSCWFSYQGHDNSKWKAHFKDDRFMLKPDGYDGTHGCDAVDYIDQTGQKWRASFSDGMFTATAVSGKQEIRVSDSINCLQWDGNPAELSLRRWNEEEMMPPFEELEQKKIRLFGIRTPGTDEVRAVSTRVHYCVRDGCEEGNRIFEYVAAPDGTGEKFHVYDQNADNGEFLTDSVQFCDMEGRNHILTICEDRFVVDDVECDTVRIKGSAGNEEEVLLIEWLCESEPDFDNKE